VVRLAEAILVAKPLEVAFLELVGRRVVVVHRPNVKGRSHDAADRFRRDPRQGRDGSLNSHRSTLLLTGDLLRRA
jgi:hypothetical protein